MKKWQTTTAWGCIFCTLLTGCYSTVLVDPAGDTKKKDFSGFVDFVVMKDGTKYEFDVSAKIIGDEVVGPVKDSVVSIPLSQIDKVGVWYFNTAGWIILVAIVGGVIGLVIAINEAGGIPSGF